jgi:hypothetical protein
MKFTLKIAMNGGAYFDRAKIRKNNHHFNLKQLSKIAKFFDN